MSAPLLFVTGQMRSGTTLADRLLSNMSGVDCFSQPLPLLLSQIKAAFLQKIGAPAQVCTYPLNDQQFENAYAKEDFLAYLNALHLDRATLASALQAMETYSGQKFKPDHPEQALEDWQRGDLADFAAHYFTVFAQKPIQNTQTRVWKETSAEAYLPYFLARGMKAILIIRDPRDVAASLYYGRAGEHTGTPRPLLFMARQWRTSAAWFGHYAEHPLVRTVRYEDLVQAPEQHIEEWQSWLGLPKSTGALLLHAKDGQAWQGNSSFGAIEGVSTQAIGRHKTLLPPQQCAFIEALCHGEMRQLGYAPFLQKSAIGKALKAGPGEDYLHREALAHYAYTADRQSEETARWQNLQSAQAKFDPAMFLFEAHFDTLREITLRG
jgi:Sulfotransferase family